MTSSQQILDRLGLLHPKAIDLDLSRVRRLLADLGNPHEKLPPVIHVAGTNGKGSTIAFMRAICETAGLSVHVYTSPHLVHFNERIRLSGKLISDEYLCTLLEEIEKVNKSKPITFFEVTTVVALLAFSRMPADVVLLETGLGGRLDATNVIEKPALTIITPLSIDHTGFLGNTYEKIAFEKAGIMKKGVYCITAKQPQEALDILQKRANDLNVSLIKEGKDWSVEIKKETFLYQGKEKHFVFPLPSLKGEHQIHNAGVAITAILHSPLQKKVKEKDIVKGLQHTQWLGRLQQLKKGKLVNKLPSHWELWIDGGHNIGAAKELLNMIQKWKDKDLYLIVGMLERKDAKGFLKPFIHQTKKTYTIPVSNMKKISDFKSSSFVPEKLAHIVQGLGGEVSPCKDVNTAVGFILKNKNPARILITGSLYLIGHVLKKNGTIIE